MKRKIFSFIMFVSIFLCVSCGDVVTYTEGTDLPIEPTEEETDIPTEGNPTEGEEEIEFTVGLTFGGVSFIDRKITEYVCVWSNGSKYYEANFNSEGIAKVTGLDGEFNVYLAVCPEGYTHDPNIYTTDINNRHVNIELINITRNTLFEKNFDGSNWARAYEIDKCGTYRAPVKSGQAGIHYIYTPNVVGYYRFTSFVNIHENTVNPSISVYNGNKSSGYWYLDKVYNSGGATNGGYTNNFEYVFEIWESTGGYTQLGNSFGLTINAQSINNEYPVYVDFTIEYLGLSIHEDTDATIINPKATLTQTPDIDNLTYYNADGGTGNYYNSTVTNGSGHLDGSKFKYNPADGYWHVYDPDTDTFGPILCAAITQPCAYYEEALSRVESHGNSALTVSGGTESYKAFIEVYYAGVCNSDGVCYVTDELKEFLQKFSISQMLFRDGMGFVENVLTAAGAPTFALEEDQWLFACGYYA